MIKQLCTIFLSFVVIIRSRNDPTDFINALGQHSNLSEFHLPAEIL